MTFYPALTIIPTEDREADVLRIMTEVNAIMEGWIRERPAQWLWLHKRWPN
jgi:KDO2-lipid IV(A) lauroyltransferase